jgi:hypothetical protein
MMIVDAISSAPTEHAVYFLVTAYMESLRTFEESCGVPEPVTRLPIAGEDDLHRRLDILRSTLATPLENVVPVTEVSAVLDCAVRRLAGLVGSEPPPNADLLMHRVRNDSPHSSPSV